jgi:hypothetical protein
MRSHRFALALVVGVGAMLGVAGTAHATTYTLYGTDGTSTCSTKLSSVSAAGLVSATDTVDREIGSVDVKQSIDSADYWECNAAGTPIHIAGMKGYNRYVFTGVQISGCTVGFPGGFNCSFSGGSSTLTDTSPASCTSCSHLDFDQFGVKVSWRSGVITHYSHVATGYFRGSSGSTIQVASNVDKDH